MRLQVLWIFLLLLAVQIRLRVRRNSDRSSLKQSIQARAERIPLTNTLKPNDLLGLVNARPAAFW
jgi:hypothetical protein